VTIDPLLAALMVQTVYAYPVTGTSAYGQPVFATTPLTIPCHIVGRVQEVTNFNGENMVSTGYAITSDVYTGLDDRATLDIPEPSDPTGRRRVNIIAVATRYDENGPSHQTIYYGPRGGSGRETNA
jgi:hypothetical protein